MIFDPLVSWLVPVIGFLSDKINTLCTQPIQPAPKTSHPEPHRDPESGKIIIENGKLYKEDVMNFGAVQAQKWVREGKYNLTPDELEKEHERIKKELEYLYKL